MKKRTLVRKVIIREYDFQKVKDEATSVICDGVALYDRASFMPLNQDALEKLRMMDILKGKTHTPLLEAKYDLKFPGALLWELKDYLYNSQYCNWLVTTDEDGYMCVQARKNTPKTRLGWAVFEKDYGSRL